MTTTPRKRSIASGALRRPHWRPRRFRRQNDRRENPLPPRVEGQTPPPVVLAENVAGRRLPETERQLALQGIHWIFGALAGAVYGALVEVEPSFGAWRGAAFGITLNRLTHETILPKMGLAAPPGQQPAQERISEWVTHAAYGVATDTVRRAVRRVL